MTWLARPISEFFTRILSGEVGKNWWVVNHESTSFLLELNGLLLTNKPVFRWVQRQEGHR
jgi:hypothetical protein